MSTATTRSFKSLLEHDAGNRPRVVGRDHEKTVGMRREPDPQGPAAFRLNLTHVTERDARRPLPAARTSVVAPMMDVIDLLSYASVARRRTTGTMLSPSVPLPLGASLRADEFEF